MVAAMSRRSTVDRRSPSEPATTAETRPLLVPAAEAARLLGIGRTTLYELVKRGELTPIRIGRCVRFSVVELVRFVERRNRAA
jgi:excisionase family DNA binding protein